MTHKASNQTNTPGCTTNLRELTNYTKPGVTRQNLAKSEHCSFSLVCLTAGTAIPEHTAPRDVSITVIEGHGVFNLNGQEITLQPGVFIYMPANVPHALHAFGNLAFLHT